MELYIFFFHFKIKISDLHYHCKILHPAIKITIISLKEEKYTFPPDDMQNLGVDYHYDIMIL